MIGIRRYIATLAIGIFALYGLYSILHNSGLYAWAVQLQVQLTGYYEQNISMLLTFAPALAASIWLRFEMWLFLRQAARRNTSDGAAALLDSRFRFQLSLFCAALAIATGIGLGSYRLTASFDDAPDIMDFRLGEPRTLNLNRSYILTGIAQPAFTTILETGDGSRSAKVEYFFPLTGADWTPDQPIRFLFDAGGINFFKTPGSVGMMQGHRLDESDSFVFEAVQPVWIVKNGLSPALSQYYEENGLSLAKPHYVLSTGEHPALVIIYVGLVLAGIVLLMSLIYAVRYGRHLRLSETRTD